MPAPDLGCVCGGWGGYPKEALGLHDVVGGWGWPRGTPASPLWQGRRPVPLSLPQDLWLQGHGAHRPVHGTWDCACQCVSVCEGRVVSPRPPPPPLTSGHCGRRPRPRKWLTTHTLEGGRPGPGTPVPVTGLASPSGCMLNTAARTWPPPLPGGGGYMALGGRGELQGHQVPTRDLYAWQCESGAWFPALPSAQL